jgi:hypothetical protein
VPDAALRRLAPHQRKDEPGPHTHLAYTHALVSASLMEKARNSIPNLSLADSGQRNPGAGPFKDST